MMLILINSEGREMLGSSGAMPVDKRLNLSSLKERVRDRNKSKEKNFPYEVAIGFKFWDNSSIDRYNSSSESQIYYL